MKGKCRGKIDLYLPCIHAEKITWACSPGKQKSKMSCAALDSQSIAPEAASGNLLNMQILRTCPWPIESEILEVGPSDLCFNKSSGWFWYTLKFENH